MGQWVSECGSVIIIIVVVVVIIIIIVIKFLEKMKGQWVSAL